MAPSYGKTSAAGKDGDSPDVARVLVASDAPHPTQDLGHVDLGVTGDHGVDVDPVLGTIEHCLADDEVLRGEDRDAAIAKRHDLARCTCRVVKSVVGEEQVNGCGVPHATELAIALNDRRDRWSIDGRAHPAQ